MPHGLRCRSGRAPCTSPTASCIQASGSRPYQLPVCFPLQVWAGATHFPDFFLPRVRDYFTRLLQEHHGLVPWDGIWVRRGRVGRSMTPAWHGAATQWEPWHGMAWHGIRHS